MRNAIDIMSNVTTTFGGLVKVTANKLTNIILFVVAIGHVRPHYWEDQLGS